MFIKSSRKIKPGKLIVETSLQNAKWLWLPQERDKAHQYVCFRKKIKINNPGPGEFYIAADTDFIVWINGQEIGRGQFPDYPQQKSYSSFKADNLRDGENIICVMAYYCGEDFSTYAVGRAGMIAVLKTGKNIIITDGSWRCAQHPAFQSGNGKESIGVAHISEVDVRITFTPQAEAYL